MTIGIIFAVIAAVVFGLWTVFHNQASELISPVLGAILVSLTAVIVGAPFLFREWVGGNIQIGHKGIFFIVLAGLSAFALDYFVLRTYSAGIPISIGGPIIIGGSIAVATMIGLFLGEQMTALKFFGVVLVVVGATMLSTTT